MTHHLELAQGSRRSNGVPPPLGPLNNFINGCERLHKTLFIEWLGAEGCSELNRSQFVRLSQELEDCFPNLRGTHVQRLKDLCLHANCSEEFFLSGSKDQWLRTVITSDEHPETLLCSNEAIIEQRLISSITVHSIVVPCYPYWSKLQAARRDEVARESVASSNTKRLYFPSTFLEDALSTGMSIVQKLNEWEEREEAQCAIADQWHEELRDGVDQESSSWRPFWEIRPDDIDVKNRNFGGGGQAAVGKVSWRGGIFVRKDFKHKSIFDTELEAVLRVSHPHVVYSFGVSISTDKKQYSLLMELLDRDLLLLIEDRVRFKGRNEPPFSCLESVDMLLQIAKAMAHMHELPEPVIHGDLKPKNILVSQCEILGDVCQFLVKVADFGSARILKQNSCFNPDGGTTAYAAPEVLATKLYYPERKVDIKDPKKIDVYSFGILAFQILTGLEPYKEFPSLLVAVEGDTELVPYEGVSSRQSLKEGVIAGHLRPPLREACGRPNFWNDLDLVAIVESCWHRDALARPAFSEVTSRLQSIYNHHLNLDPTTEAHAFARSSQANAINSACQRTVNESHAFIPPAQATSNADDDGRAQASNPPSYYEDKQRKSFRKKFVFANLLSCTRVSPGNVTD